MRNVVHISANDALIYLAPGKKDHQYFVHNFSKSGHILIILVGIIAVIRNTKKRKIFLH